MKLALRLLALIAIVAGTALALHRWTIVPLRCAERTWHAGRALDAAEREGDAAMRRTSRDVLATLDGCDAAPSHELFFVRAGAARALGDPRAAMDGYRRALELDRRPETYLGLGLSALDAHDRQTAMESLTRACAFDPARLQEIPYDDVRRETARRVRAAYGDRWLP